MTERMSERQKKARIAGIKCMSTKPFFKVKRDCELLDSFVHGDFCNHPDVHYGDGDGFCNGRVCPKTKEIK